jgi:DNA-binding CsgD family transcriptional regulator
MLKQETGRFMTAFGDKSLARGSLVHARPAAVRADAGEPVPATVCIGLTARQRDVLAVMMQGKSNKAICRVLNLAEPTVKNHVTAILKALKVSNRTEAVIKVAKASVASMSYRYTISGHSTFLLPIDASAPPTSPGRFEGRVSADARIRNNP